MNTYMHTFNETDNIKQGHCELYYREDERLEANKKLLERNLPSGFMETSFSMRPVSTKYATMPIFDQRAQSDVTITCGPFFNVGKTFNPGNAQGPWSGFASNVDVETILRNQAFALQKGDQATYVPESHSDLYVNTITEENDLKNQPFPGLFDEQRFAQFNPNNFDLGQNVFNNYTRQQLKNFDEK